MNELAIAADLGGTHVRAATIDCMGKAHQRVKQKTPKSDNADDIVRALVAFSKEFIDAQNNKPFKAMSIVVPGTVQAESGKVMKAPNLPCLDGFRLAAALAGELKIPVLLENDANAAAVGEMWQGAAKGVRSIVCVTLGTGVGGGIILDGKLWRGIDGSAAEIGHIGVEPFGPPCGCGSRGCLEVFSSATAIVRMTRELGPDYSSSSLNGVRDLTAETVYKKGLEGDELALEVFRRAGFYLGVGLASVINVLNPEVIVIGGGVAAGWDLFINHVNEQITKRAFPEAARRAKVVRARCGDDAGLLGAAYLAFATNSLSA
jgi:glucokinase